VSADLIVCVPATGEGMIEAVVANHVGEGMVRTLDAMRLPLHFGAAGDARAAVQGVGREL
jgi:hypothetical protein